MENRKTLKKVIAIAIILIIGISAAYITHLQNPWSFDGWYQCAEQNGFSDSGEDIYLVIGNDMYAVIKCDGNIYSEIQTGSIKKNSDKSNGAPEFILSTNTWDSAKMLYARAVGMIILKGTTADGDEFDMIFTKAGTAKNIELPELQ